MLKCGGCSRAIEGPYTTALGKNWHPDCFRCAACDKPLAAQFFERGNKPYHEECFHQQFSPRCAGCNQPITGKYTNALGKTWHPEHFVCVTCHKPIAGKKFFERDNEPYCEECFHQQFSPHCAGCNQPITGKYTNALGKTWHPEHFVCAQCHKPFAGEKFFERDAEPYCENCFHERYSPRCQICGEPMRAEHLENYWGEKYCKRHERELERCESCSRLISTNLTDGGITYADGRAMCNRCRKTAIEQVWQGQPILARVLQTLEMQGLVFPRQDFSLRLTDRVELKRLASKSHAKQPTGMARTQLTTQNGRVVKREVQEILILHGLPQEHWAAVAAHELGHVWLFLNECPELAPQEEEGFSELCAYLWLKTLNGSDAAYRLNLMENNDDPIYGHGFQRALTSFNRRGLATLTRELKQRKRFP